VPEITLRAAVVEGGRGFGGARARPPQAGAGRPPRSLQDGDSDKNLSIWRSTLFERASTLSRRSRGRSARASVFACMPAPVQTNGPTLPPSTGIGARFA